MQNIIKVIEKSFILYCNVFYKILKNLQKKCYVIFDLYKKIISLNYKIFYTINIFGKIIINI